MRFISQLVGEVSPEPTVRPGLAFISRGLPTATEPRRHRLGRRRRQRAALGGAGSASLDVGGNEDDRAVSRSYFRWCRDHAPPAALLGGGGHANVYSFPPLTAVEGRVTNGHLSLTHASASGRRGPVPDTPPTEHAATGARVRFFVNRRPRHAAPTAIASSEELFPVRCMNKTPTATRVVDATDKTSRALRGKAWRKPGCKEAYGSRDGKRVKRV